jgi:hypothetical protein
MNNKDYQEEIGDLIIDIFREIWRINSAGSYTLFLNFSGHVNSIDLYGYKGKWNSKKERYIDINDIYLREDEAIDELNKMLMKLKNM